MALVKSVVALRDRVSRVYVVAYKEETSALEDALRDEGFSVDVVRQRDNTELDGKSSIYRCLLNHRRVWEMVAVLHESVLVVEADFVLVRGFGRLPLPFPPASVNLGIAWLYTCGPTIYRVTANGHIEGQSGSMVAYIVSPIAAAHLQEFADGIRDMSSNGHAYVPWDTRIYGFLKSKGLKCYLGFRNYGEHGGEPSPEHGQNKMRHRGGHHADVIWGRLSFLPSYAGQAPWAHLKFLSVRFQARLRGVGRVLLGRYLSFRSLREVECPLRLLGIALGRHCYLPRPLPPWPR